MPILSAIGCKHRYTMLKSAHRYRRNLVSFWRFTERYCQIDKCFFRIAGMPMLLTISTTYQPATDLGYLLHKNPGRLQTFSLPFGKAHVFYPEATSERCTAALMLDIDAVRLVRNRDRTQAQEQYVNDRPYVASSFLGVAIADVFGSALNGHCVKYPDLVKMPLPLQAQLAAVPSRNGGEEWLRRLFEPLGYTVTITPHLLYETYSAWGDSPYFTVTLDANCLL